jgi:hypothetical protein
MPFPLAVGYQPSAVSKSEKSPAAPQIAQHYEFIGKSIF